MPYVTVVLVNIKIQNIDKGDFFYDNIIYVYVKIIITIDY